MRNRIQNLSHKPISKRKVYNKTNEIDLCRCCHAQGSFTHLYVPHVWRNTEVVVYSDLLRECIGVELFMVTEPSHGNACAICDDCIEQLHGAMWFKKQILKCEMQFRELYTKHVIEDSFLEVEIETNEPEYDCADNMESNEEALCTECGHNISDYGNGADSNTNDAGVPPTPPVRDFDDDMGLLSDHEEAVFSKHKMKEMKLANKRKYTKKSNLGENKKKAAKKKAEPRPEDVVEELEENDCADNMKSNEEALCTESGHDKSDDGNGDEGNGADINANDAGVPPTPPVRDFDDDMGLLSDHEEAVFSKLKMEGWFNTDRVSFAGSVVKKIAKGYAKLDLRSEIRKSELITDDQLRRLRLASLDYRAQQRRDKKVSISINLPCEKDHHSKIKRRTTGFVRPEDMEKIRVYSKSSVQVDDADDDDDDDEDSEDDEDSANRKVRIADTGVGTGHGITSGRRPTGYVRTGDIDIDDDDDESNTEVRQSVLVRLFDDVKGDDEPPTLKDYKPSSESHQKGILLKFSSNYRIKSDESTKERYLRQSLTVGGSYERVLNLQHGKRASRKISTDYVKTIDQMEQRPENSIRSVEFAKTRPAMSVAEYQMRNKMYQDSKKLLKRPSGLRLPGDSPLYSSTNGMFHQSHSRMGQ